MPKTSAGLLMFRKKNNQLEFFLVHPGGPIFKNKDNGVWSIPKGQLDDGEDDLFSVAKREFQEETGINPPADQKLYIPLGEVKQKSGKIVHAWAFEGDFEGSISSNTFQFEWPPKSGKFIEIPEVDRGEFFSLEIAEPKLNLAQFEFCKRLTEQLDG